MQYRTTPPVPRSKSPIQSRLPGVGGPLPTLPGWTTREPLGSWVSPGTRFTYPSARRVDVGSLNLALDLNQVLKDAEFSSSEFINAAYWGE